LKESLAVSDGLVWVQTVGIREAFGRAYNLQFRVLIAFAGRNVLVAVLLVLAVRKKEKRTEEEGRDKVGRMEGDGNRDVKKQVEVGDQKVESRTEVHEED
jgi:hypothetical protein